LAEPGTVVIGPTTRKMVGAGFECEDLGDKTLAGVSEPVRVWRVLRSIGQTSRFDAMRAEALMPLVGRQEEITILARRWNLAKKGKGQVVVLSGEPGIGKSRLVRPPRTDRRGRPYASGLNAHPFTLAGRFTYNRSG
jgi:hypothetical protein